ncbi:hypothetical protein QO010_002765 [Caulobacter ginsengisoli]|uniref:Hydrogenase n=1 Tax=Caulobacter ginsengisoli TaxID=400775 RepID=A0ABU0ISJ4_9CAUL|nr:hypothetical protein [Caulobacter ginsengisoli]MDQ0464981.1 hypothetical protein [Caulobacter ginsengisoli]
MAFNRPLALGGLTLFFFGLILGFIVPAYAPHHGMLSAHLNAVQTGTFVLVLALFWPKLPLGRMAGWLAHLTWASFWLLQIGITLAAQAQVSPDLAGLKPAVLGIEAICSLGVTLATALVLWTVLRHRLSSGDAQPRP